MAKAWDLTMQSKQTQMARKFKDFVPREKPKKLRRHKKRPNKQEKRQKKNR